MIEAIEQPGPRERQISLNGNALVDAWGNCYGDAWFNWFQHLHSPGGPECRNVHSPRPCAMLS